METTVKPRFNEVPRDWGNWFVKVVRPKLSRWKKTNKWQVPTIPLFDNKVSLNPRSRQSIDSSGTCSFSTYTSSALPPGSALNRNLGKGVPPRPSIPAPV